MLKRPCVTSDFTGVALEIILPNSKYNFFIFHITSGILKFILKWQQKM